MPRKVFTKKSKSIIFAVNFILLVIVGLIQYSYQLSDMRSEFNHNIENIIEKQFSDKVSSTKAVLISLSSMHKSINNKMQNSEFSILSKDLLKNYNYINGIGYATIVKNEDRESFIEETRETGLYNFDIVNYKNEKWEKFIPKKDEFKLYAPIIYIEPANYKYSNFYGVDMYNNPSLHRTFQRAAREDRVFIVDRINTPFGYELNLFIKSTYKGENDKQSEEYKLRNTNGFFIIDIDIDKLLVDIKSKFEEYDIKVLKKEDYTNYMQTNHYGEYFKELQYFKKISAFNNCYLYVKKDIQLKDFNVISFLLVIFLVIIIQVLYVIVWRKDKEAKIELKYKATHDDLTELPNRNYFRKEFYQILYKTKKNLNNKAALLFIDLDRFKEINDSFGHKFGDEVLIEVSKRLQSVMRKNDMICRHGGDEFLILIDHYTDLEFIVKIVKKIMATTTEPVAYDNHKIHLTLSIGISLYPDDAKTADDLLKNADSAMYRAKDEGRNTYKFYTEDMTSEVMQKVVLENRLREAINNNEFVVYYQPQYCGKRDILIGMEALVRWESDSGLIPPYKFIPLAEETGLIVELDRLVMKKAIKQLSIWKEKGYKGTLSLNLSMKQLKSKDFTSLFKTIVEESVCNAKDIELEVTEGEIMENPTDAIEKLKDLSSFGVKLSVDDFGTGYSSLAYLKKLPIDKLKIDRAFVKDLPDDEDDIAITKSIIALAKSLNLDLIAEGVENEKQKEFLVENGCSNIQGYLYGKPMNPIEIELLLQRDS